MLKKYIIILIFLLALTGCSSEYNIEFNNNKIKEEIITNISSSDIPNQDSSIAEVDDRVTPFIQEDQYPFADDEEKKYKKTVNEESGNTKVTLQYTYSHDDYRKSKVYNTCFEKKSFNNLDNGYQLNFSGTFYCLYGDEVVVNIKTNNKVISNNATKVNGNTYTWIINAENVNDVNIDIKISKYSKVVDYVLYAVAIIIFIVAGIFGYNIYQKIKNRDSVNEI